MKDIILNQNKDTLKSHSTANPDTRTPATIGGRIRALREKKGMSQQVLADRINVNKSVISHWENDGRVPNMDMINALAEVFAVSARYLSFGVDFNNSEYLDLGGLTLYQIKLVRDLVDEFRKRC